MIGVQISHDMGTFRHVDGHIHLEAIQWRTLDDNLRGVTEISKLHQFVQLVVRRQRRVTQHVAHICRAQHFQTSTHREVVQRTAHAGKHVDESLAIGDALRILLGTDNLVVTGLHTQIDHHLVYMAEVNVTLDIQRVVVMGIDCEILEQQL